MADVLTSYSRADQPIAERLSELLSNEGWDVWFDAGPPQTVRPEKPAEPTRHGSRGQLRHGQRRNVDLAHVGEVKPTGAGP